jgi:hypothetical protein
MAGGITLLIFEIYVLRKVGRLTREGNVADQFFFAILVLETDKDVRDESFFKWQFAVRLEKLAKGIERIPFAISGVAPAVRKELFTLSYSKAQAVRNIEILAVKAC